ncbi:MAG: aminopeptidase [Longimicrobiales bacterium]|nr:aminopeptidase [Longimicrobiales bacterium]
MSSRRRPQALRRIILAGALLLLPLLGACSPVYVVKAGIAEVGILRARQPIPRVLADTTVDADTRAKLAWIMETRRFAAEDLGYRVGEAYTQYTRLESDTLALVVSAAYQDRLIPKTWWFPIVGHVPYKGHFSLDGALSEADDLRADGYDAYVRPTSAFSTLGWFNDPVLSTQLRTDDVEVVTTTLHELTHREIFVPGHVTFNESLATFVGRVAAIRFFCTREGGGPDTVKCARAQARWRDVVRFGAFIDDLVDDLQIVYYDASLDRAGKLQRREEVFSQALERFDNEVAPALESLTFASFRNEPLNNATLLSRYRYYHRLEDFQALLELYNGDLPRAMSDLRARSRRVDDPFELLPTGP